MWWQGEENCPDIVKLCLASLRKNCSSHKIILITKDNFQQYADIPEHILRKVNDGKITLTHFSDIIRTKLLEQHGGLWVDATIFVAGKIPEEIFDAEFFTLKLKAAKIPRVLTYHSAGGQYFSGVRLIVIACCRHSCLKFFWST